LRLDHGSPLLLQVLRLKRSNGKLVSAACRRQQGSQGKQPATSHQNPPAAIIGVLLHCYLLQFD
jgi:hypothetical protein